MPGITRQGTAPAISILMPYPPSCGELGKRFDCKNCKLRSRHQRGSPVGNVPGRVSARNRIRAC